MEGKPKKVNRGKQNERATLPFDEALRRLASAKPKPKKTGAAGSGGKPKSGKAKTRKDR